MNKLLITLLFYLNCFSVELYAQDKAYFSLKDTKISFSLKDEYYIERIIDARPLKDSLGIYFRENIQKDIELENTLEDAITKATAHYQRKEIGKKPLVLKINHFFMTDKRKIGEAFSYVELRISFLERQNNGSLRELFEANRVNITNSVDYHEAYFQNNIKQVFENAIYDFFSRKTDNKLPEPVLIDDSDLYEAKSILSHLCYTKPCKKRGLYQTYYDFRDQIVDTSYFFYNNPFQFDTILFNNRKVHGSEIKMTSLDRELPWGYCDGENFHVKIGEKYFQLYEYHGDLLCNYFIQDKSKYDFDIIVTVVGAGFGVGLATTLGSVLVNEIIDFEKDKKQPLNQASIYKINPNHGFPSKVDLRFYDNYIVVYDIPKSKVEKTPIWVYENGYKIKTLKKGEFFQRKFSAYQQTNELCFAAEGYEKACTKVNNVSYNEGMNLISITLDKEKLKIENADYYWQKAAYKNIFNKLQIEPAYKNTTLNNHFTTDTTELLITKANNSFKTSTKILLDGKELCSLTPNEYLKINIFNTSEDPNLCFIDEKQRKVFLPNYVYEKVEKKAVVIIREDNNFAAPKVYTKSKDIEKWELEIKSQKAEKCLNLCNQAF